MAVQQVRVLVCEVAAQLIEPRVDGVAADPHARRPAEPAARGAAHTPLGQRDDGEDIVSAHLPERGQHQPQTLPVTGMPRLAALSLA